ncbi:SURF1 family protein [Palleronia caenipelagi]|uniref:SURF1-like protein n=1 Tax=Palleronia caenipelagi TaxID=2489174 RepID=A0A547Q7N6_9RHOB|nr:SURF1 family protein [Palleronia caenipelagi]TRD22400.1 SURF1 family protein [Palleronia caenipelagi]
MADRRRPVWLLGLILTLGTVLAVTLAGLGVWQFQRLGWKKDLIARVEARLASDPVPVDSLIGQPDPLVEYQPATVTGRFAHDRELLVKAVTELGGGYWVLTPLIRDGAPAVFVNRGFVPPDQRDPATRDDPSPTGEVTVTGLARLTEPGGAFLRDNDPEGGWWYSRDVAAMADAVGVPEVLPIFVDAGPSDPWPVGGLTVVTFRNTHLSYALTWFALCAMVVGGMVILIRYERAGRD